ncbi:hypothetical protein N7G274_007459 [Stereocaulon virgatum]|uniref:Threonylcarbamoyl-AMP synthase n=1 Tax=Stereocaulon virgatum TaxID=373712 RepID=A0ABR4A3F8_9LECA
MLNSWKYFAATMAGAHKVTLHTQHGTQILQADASAIGRFVFDGPEQSFLGDWHIELSKDSPDAANLQEAASRLRDTDIPVAFPTETVYGLGADATRSAAVRGIYSAKGRPSDNPLIIHISSLSNLRRLLAPKTPSVSGLETPPDPVPPIYYPLISRFWPGPLTILLPLPTPSPLAAEVTASLPTVAVRMPSSTLALALIHLANVPIAAPSANASSKPSPTTAAHVLHDLSGRIDLILDGGPCGVGVESTVVDGLVNPPVILRPGGVSIDMLRSCPGWENVQVEYKDGAETRTPRAPGMKYKHYSPNARVLLFRGQMDAECAKRYLGKGTRIGVLTTKTWQKEPLQSVSRIPGEPSTSTVNSHVINGYRRAHEARECRGSEPAIAEIMPSLMPVPIPSAQYSRIELSDQDIYEVWTVGLGQSTAGIARGLFSALRELDQKGVDIIFVEGIDDNEGHAAAAIMNRLRKAAEAEIVL